MEKDREFWFWLIIGILILLIIGGVAVNKGRPPQVIREIAYKAPPEEKPEVAENISYVFLVDKSGSMRKDHLIDRVKGALDTFVYRTCEDGSYVIFKTFGTDVYDEWRGVIRENTRRGLGRIIDGIQARDQWTWMSRAFRELYNDIKRLKEERKGVIYVYLFTDGKNEPPPEKGEAPEEFRKVLARYFPPESLVQFNSFFYYITFRVKPPEEVEEWARKDTTGRISVVEKPVVPTKPEEIVPVELVLTPGRYHSRIDIREGKTIRVPFGVKLSQNLSSLHIKAGTKDTVIENLTQRTRKIVISYGIEDTTYGVHKGKITFAPGEGVHATINPSEFTVEYEVLKPLPLAARLLIIAGILCILVGILRWIYCTFFAYPLVGEIEYEGPGMQGRYTFSRGMKCRKYNLSKLLKAPLPVRIYIHSAGRKRVNFCLINIPPHLKVKVDGIEKKGKRLNIKMKPGSTLQVGEWKITYR